MNGTPRGYPKRCYLAEQTEFPGAFGSLAVLRCLEAALLGHLHLCPFFCLMPFPGDHEQAGMRQGIWAPSLGVEGTGPERPPRAWTSTG